MTVSEALLELRELSIQVAADRGFLAVDAVSLSIQRGEALGIVGENGAGKSLLALSIVRLLPAAATVVSGGPRFDGIDLLGASEETMRSIRGRRIAMVFQESLSALNPVLTVGRQVAEVFRHRGMSRSQARGGALEALRQVGFGDPEQWASSYPHELSGGMRQRVCLAMALAGEPSLLIADEPTTALDATIAASNLAVLSAQRAQRGLSVLLISHDLRAVASFADRVAVMYAGQVVELAGASGLFTNPRHPYTRALLRCGVAEESAPGSGRGRLVGIPGAPPEPGRSVAGCRFRPRCERADRACEEDAPDLVGREHSVRCFHPVDEQIALASGAQ